MGDQNPWVVKNIEAFSFYCCPECDFKSKDGGYFKKHAMESHNKSKIFFMISKSENHTNNDSMEVETEPQSQDEKEEGMDDFIDTLVKEESISESVIVRLSELIAQKLINRPDDIKQKDPATFDGSFDFIDDQGLENNVEELETFESYENMTDTETSDDETFDCIDEAISESKKDIESKSYVVNTHKCPVCEKEFIDEANWRWNMKVHMKNIHEVKDLIPIEKKFGSTTKKLETFKPLDFDDEPINTESKKAEFCLTKNGKQGIKFGGHIFVKDKKTYSRASKYKERTHSGFSYRCSRLM